MRSLLTAVLVLLSSSAFAQGEEEMIFRLKTTRTEMFRICKECDAEMLKRDTIRFEYSFAGLPGFLEIVFDSTGHVSSGWANRLNDNFTEIQASVMSRLIKLFGEPEPMATQGIKSWRWISGSTEIGLTSIESLKVLAIEAVPYVEESE